MIEEDKKASNIAGKMKSAVIGASVATASAGNAKVADVNYTSDYKNLGPDEQTAEYLCR